MKKELLKSVQEINVHENEELYQQADQADPVIEDYEEFIRSKKISILNVAFEKFLKGLETQKYLQMCLLNLILSNFATQLPRCAFR